jgi:phage tail sheath protein FI
LPARGVVCYGARTLSVNPFYRFAATRVILNVLAGTLSRAYDSVVFSLVDGQGALFARVRQTAENLCEQLRQAGGLYGATPDEAYLVVCDNTNNPLSQLEAGTVYLDVVVKPSPTMEALNITLSRASLSTVFTEVASSGDTAAVATS